MLKVTESYRVDGKSTNSPPHLKLHLQDLRIYVNTNLQLDFKFAAKKIIINSRTIEEILNWTCCPSNKLHQ